MEYNPADLTSVLRTLSSLSQHQQQQPQSQSHTQQQQHTQSHTQHHQQIQPQQSQPQQSQPQQSQPQQQSQQPKQLKKEGKEQEITSWPPALKHIMQTFTSESLQHRIRFLIHRQHDHERQWYEGREALLTKQKGRAEKKRELDAVLRSVGAPVEEGDVSTVEEDQAELRKYDMKVYQASRQMSDALVSELKALQIPFFSIRASLVDSKDGISKEELGTLRKRMLEVLMDLCR